LARIKKCPLLAGPCSNGGFSCQHLLGSLLTLFGRERQNKGSSTGLKKRGRHC
jgi:hypothetical protein